MSNGLIHPDSPQHPRASTPEPRCPSPTGLSANDLPSRGVALPEIQTEKTSALAQCYPAESSSSNDGGEIAGTLAPSSLGGLVEDQPPHCPAADGPLPASTSEPADDTSAEETEVPWSLQVPFRLIEAAAGSTAVALVIAVLGLLGLHIYFQVLSLVATLATLPFWLTTIAVVVLGLLLSVVAVAFVRLALVWSKLRPNMQFRLNDIDELKRHAGIRRSCSRSQKRQEARRVLTDYISSYPQYDPRRTTSSFRQSETTRDCPFSVEQKNLLCRAQRRLADPTGAQDTKQWLDVYATEFQAVLDDAARARVDECARWVGVKTAISPNALVDTCITTYWSFVLLRDLCVIYNVRVGGLGTATLLWRAFFSAYVAGKLQEVEEQAEVTIESLLDGLPEISRNLMGKIAAKAGAGLANYFLMRRLGKRAIALLMPLVADAK